MCFNFFYFCIFYVPCFASSSSSSQTRSVSVGVKNQSFHSCCKLSRTSCPLRSKVSTRIVVFHITMVMYIHVYNTVSFSADTVINTTCKPIVESRPGQKKTDLNRTFKGTYLCFCMLLSCTYCTLLLRTTQCSLDWFPTFQDVISFTFYWDIWESPVGCCRYCIDGLCGQKTNPRSDKTGEEKKRHLLCIYTVVVLQPTVGSQMSEVSKHSQRIFVENTSECVNWSPGKQLLPKGRKHTNRTEGWFLGRVGSNVKYIQSVVDRLQHAKAPTRSFKWEL